MMSYVGELGVRRVKKGNLSTVLLLVNMGEMTCFMEVKVRRSLVKTPFTL